MNVSDRSAEPESEETVEMLHRKRRKRTIISPEQLLKLEELYKLEQWPGRDKKEELAQEIEMSSHFVNIWFQNKRSRVKKLAQEEEEIKAMKGRLNVSSPCNNNKVLLAPKSSKAGISGIGAVATRLSLPVVSAPQNVVPAVGCLPVFTISTKNGYNPDSGFTSLPQLAVPLIPQNTIFTTIPQSDCLQRKDQLKLTSSASASTAKSSISLLLSGTSRSSRPAAKHLSSVHQSKRFKSTSVKTSLSISSSSTDSNETMKQSALQQLTQHPTTSDSSNLAPAHDSPCKMMDTLARTQDATNNAPPSTLLRCMILMMALSELPCSVPKDSSEFDLAVCATLYGVKLENGRVMTYNKQDGFHVGKVARKSKNGKKKKKKRRTSKKK